jgi:HPt (histidine-containing phosphotransfer) domain-containing protein
MQNTQSVLYKFQFNPGLDTKYLSEIFEGDPENVSYIFSLYLAELPGMIHSIKQESEDNNMTELNEIFHKTKTSFSFVGLTHITVLMEQLEKRCLNINNAAELTGEINHLLETIEQSTPLIMEEYSRLTLYSNKLVENQLHYC